ncbi:MAG: cysteine methyltransferase [Hyphomicrobiales bacterium]|nr:MAG: cysteine methyltransferase [Hyphomicrobiales bacterium]
MSNPELAYTYLESPIGQLLVAGDEQHLYYISFPGGKGKITPHDNWHEDPAPFKEIAKQLTAYFKGELENFDIPMVLNGTDFQENVWTALCDIPYGETISYGELARRIDRPKASRAVGAANGANHLPIIIPCHRVIGANNSLTGFGGGIETKQYLLQHEQGEDPQLTLI